MKRSVVVRFVIIGILWLLLCCLLLTRSKVNPYTLFVIIASGIIVFVPLYKKYVRDANDNK